MVYILKLTLREKHKINSTKEPYTKQVGFYVIEALGKYIKDKLIYSGALEFGEAVSEKHY